MPFVPVENTVELELRQAYSGENIENTLYFHKAAGWTLEEIGTLCANVAAWWIAGPRTQLVTGLALIAIHATDLTSETGAILDFVTGLPSAGSDTEEGMPSNVAPCISFHTGVRGRSFRGRNYISGIGVDKVNESRILGTWMTNMEGAYADLVDVATTSAAEWVVVSRFHGMAGTPPRPVPRVTGLSTPITSASFTDNVVDSQRGRLPNH